MNQLALPIQVQSSRTNEFAKTPDQIASIERSSAELIAHRLQLETIAHEFYPACYFEKLYHLPDQAYSHVCRVWHKRCNPFLKPLPELSKIAEVKPEKKKFKPLIPHSPERKQKERRRRLVKRMSAKFSFIDLYVDAVQSQLAHNPGYFGVCSLPSEFACKAHFRSLTQERAIAYENECRAKEAGLEVVAIPVSIPDRELVAVEKSCFRGDDGH